MTPTPQHPTPASASPAPSPVTARDAARDAAQVTAQDTLRGPSQAPSTAPEPLETAYDVVVVGGGAAGLSGAVALARARRSVLVVDAGAPRNAPAEHVHNLLGLDGVSPLDLLAAGREEVARFDGTTTSGAVTATTRVQDAADGTGFRVELADGRAVRARRLLVATGLVDELPAVPGLAQRWGRDVLACPYCHGWEVRDQPIAVLATGPHAAHQALLFRQWSADVVLLQHTAPAPDDALLEQLTARGVRVVPGEVTGLRVEEDRLTGVVLAGGEVLARRALVVGPRADARTAGLEGLGLDVEDVVMAGVVVGTQIAADAGGATGVPGVWVAGNAGDVRAQVVTSAAAGLLAAAAVNADLIAEDTAAAVTVLRTGRAA